MNARIVQSVVGSPTTYRTESTISLVASATTDAIANFVMRFPSILLTKSWIRWGNTSLRS